MPKEDTNYYPEPLNEAIVNYERGPIPGLLKARQELARQVVACFSSGDPETQQKAVEGLLEAIELRMMALNGDLRSDVEDQLRDGE